MYSPYEQMPLQSIHQSATYSRLCPLISAPAVRENDIFHQVAVSEISATTTKATEKSLSCAWRRPLKWIEAYSIRGFDEPFEQLDWLLTTQAIGGATPGCPVLPTIRP
jgi:hypothetical protein